MQHLVFSEAGYNHNNEDFVRAQLHPHDKRALIGVLADGQGGQFGGGVAARVAVQTCFELALARSPAELLERQTWRAILQAADEAVEANGEAGFTTLIGVCATASQVCGASYVELCCVHRRGNRARCSARSQIASCILRLRSQEDAPLAGVFQSRIVS